MKYCANVTCKRSIPMDAMHCPYCGHIQNKQKSRSVLLFFFFGVLFLGTGIIIYQNILVSGPSPSILSTLSPSRETGTSVDSLPTNSLIPEISTIVFASSNMTPSVSEPTKTDNSSGLPVGKIVYTCQVFKDNYRNQICIMNADGSDQRRLTNSDSSNSFYPSLAPNGKSIVFSSNQTGSHEIYEMDLTGNQTSLTTLGDAYAPEISPDDQYIVFTNASGLFSSLWIMNRDGSSPHAIFQPDKFDALDPTWSPDGAKILFAMGKGDSKRLYTINPNGTNLEAVNDSFTTRGRSDWSPDGRKIAGYTGGTWKRKVSIMNSDGSGLMELFAEGNVQAPSFSPDSGWLAFTGYIDNMGNDNGCEIYILRLIGNELDRLTNNDYCDWQPRWGN